MSKHFSRRRFGGLSLAALAGAGTGGGFAGADDPGAAQSPAGNQGGFQRAGGGKPIKIVATLEKANTRVDAVAFAADGSWYATHKHGGSLITWDSATQKQLLEIQEPIMTFSISADGEQIAAGTPMCLGVPNGQDPRFVNVGIVHVWDAKTGRVVFRLPHPEHPNPVVAIGQHFIVSFGGNVMRHWFRETGKEARVVKCAAGVDINTEAIPPQNDIYKYIMAQQINTSVFPDGISVGMSADALRVAALTTEKMHCWDGLASKYFQHRIGPNLTHVALRPDGREFACVGLPNPNNHQGRDMFMRLIDVDKGTLVNTPLIPPGHWLYYLCYSADGRRLVGASRRDVFVWDAITGKLLKSFHLEDESPIRTAVFLDKNRIRIASGGMHSRGNQATKIFLPDPIVVWDRDLD